MRNAGFVAAGWALIAVGGVAYAGTASAATTCAKTVTMTFSTHDLSLAVSPSSEKVTVGDCVAFANKTHSQVDVTVSGAGAYTPVTLTAGATTPPNASFHAQSAGTGTVTGTATSLGLKLANTTGKISVAAAPTTTASPKSSPTPKSGQSGTPSARPDVAPSPKHSKGAQHPTPAPHATGVSLPPLPPLPTTGVTAIPLGSNPVVAPGPTSETPTTTAAAGPSPSAAVVAGPIEPADGNERGLPEAVGVCLVIGLATGWGRVLLASPEEAVDDDSPLGDHQA